MTTPRTSNISEFITSIYAFTSEVDRAETATGRPLWLIAIDRFQLTISAIGAVVNIMTVITLQKNGQGFQPCVSTII